MTDPVCHLCSPGECVLPDCRHGLGDSQKPVQAGVASCWYADAREASGGLQRASVPGTDEEEIGAAHEPYELDAEGWE